MNDLKALMEGVGAQYAARVKVHMKDAWDALPPEGLAAVQAATADRAQLAIRGLAGEDVSTEIKFAESTIADWAWVGADHARSALMAAATDGMNIFGVLLGALVKGVL